MLASTAKNSSRFWAKLLKDRLLNDSSGPHAFQGAPYSTSVGWPTRPTTQTAKSAADGTAARSAGTRTARSSRQRCESKALIARSTPWSARGSVGTCPVLAEVWILLALPGPKLDTEFRSSG